MTLDPTPLWISLKTATVSTLITFVLGTMIARGMVGYRGRGKGLLDSILTLPLVLPPTVVGFLLLLLFGNKGPLAPLLHQLGVTVIFTWWATVIAAVTVAFPLMYKAARGAMEQVDANLIHAARTLGASEWSIFWRILLPLAGPGIGAGTVMAFARSLGEFGATLMLAGNIPGLTQTIPVAIFFAAEGGDMEQARAWVLIITLISFVVVSWFNRRQGWGSTGLGARRP